MNRIKEMRKAAGLSSDALGERIGMSGAQVRRLETGARRLTVDWMTRIAEALECAPADLISIPTTADISGRELAAFLTTWATKHDLKPSEVRTAVIAMLDLQYPRPDGTGEKAKARRPVGTAPRPR
jgi:DNA-binding Xre family transcriptional regulator